MSFIIFKCNPNSNLSRANIEFNREKIDNCDIRNHLYSSGMHFPLQFTFRILVVLFDDLLLEFLIEVFKKSFFECSFIFHHDLVCMLGTVTE